MEKYLGNKTSLLPVIADYVQERVPHARSISDPFTGTTNVARFFRAQGWDVQVSDINRFSHTLARTYLGLQQPLNFSALTLPRPDAALGRLRKAFLATADRARNLYVASASAELWSALERGARAISCLQKESERNRTAGAIINHFTVFGKRSLFKSARGGIGKRNYFSEPNALTLDGALKTIRSWWKAGALARHELDFLMTSLLEEVVITANVSGTFHDFNRDRLWPNALQRFALRVPIVEARNGKVSVANADAVDAARWFEPHDVCYLDPPYNFRQYTAYYHFLNFIAAYPHFNDVEEYLSDLEHVRGQNMTDDHPSAYCYRDRFIGALKDLITAAPAPHVFLSYYGGRNHWNHWSVVDAPGDEGLQRLVSLFEDRSVFERCDVTSALNVRQNFQSRVGERKLMVNEYLFYGKKVHHEAVPAARVSSAPSNRELGLEAAFSPIRLPESGKELSPEFLVRA